MQRLLPLLVSTLIGAVFLAAGCSLVGNDEDDERPTPIDVSALSQDPSLLVGQWTWTRSTYFFTVDGTPVVQMPRSTGQTKRLIFTRDDTVEVYWDGQLIQSATYEEYLGQGDWGVSERIFVRSTIALDGPEVVYERVD